MEMTMTQLKPELSFWDATAIGLGAIIGGGIFVVTGVVAGVAGPALVLSILIAGLVSLLTAQSFVALTSWKIAEGSIYEFARELLSPFAGFLAGWMWIISNIFSGAAVSLAFADYFATLFPRVDARVVAVALALGFTGLNYFGIKHSAFFNNILVTLKIGVLLVFIGAGAVHLHPEHFRPFVPSTAGVFQGAFFIFFAFSGFGRVAVLAEQVHDARRNVPRAIMAALGISTLLYIVVGTVALGLARPNVLAKSSSPLAAAIGTIGHPALLLIIVFGGMVATASVLLTAILGVSHMGYAMARQGDLPRFLGRLQPKFNTPGISILAVGAAIILSTLFFNLTRVVSISTFAALFNYALVNASALRLAGSLRRRKIVSVFGFVTCLGLLVFIQRNALTFGVISLALGIIIYGLKKDGWFRTRAKAKV
jgi:APA family basic amino acid/polyamine antiporter